MVETTDELIEKVEEWLGPDGHAFFAELLLTGEGWISVHFREGMQVRNFMRMTGLCNDWTDHELDDNWMKVIEKAMS